MDPTTVPPPSPEKSPPTPPQNPHTATDAMIDASAFDCYQKSEATTGRNIDNFRALVMKLTGRFLPAHQSLIQRRLDDIFPNQLFVPDHPPYADMILTALWELNSEGGSSEEAISDFIEREYPELPWAHATMLNHHLRDLCMKGKIYMTHDRCYLRCSPIAKPVPSPSPNLSSSPSPSPSPCHDLPLSDSLCSSPISSPYSSSSSDSICSTPTSSSSSLSCNYSNKSHKRKVKRKRKRKRKRKNIKGRGCQVVQMRGRGRGRGRGRQPIMIQVGQQGTPIGRIQARGRGRMSKEVEIGEISEEEQVDAIDGDDLVVEDTNKVEEFKQVPEDQNEVMGREDEEDTIQDGDPYDTISRINQQGQEDGAGRQQNQPQKKNNTVVETGFSLGDQTKVFIEQYVGGKWNGNLEEKGESVGLRRSGRMKNDVDEGENLPCKQHKVGDKEQHRPEKKYNFTWIGRGEHIQGKGACVKQRQSGIKQHVGKEKHQPCKPPEEDIKEQGQHRKLLNVMWVGRGVRKLKEAGRDLLDQQSDDEVTELEDCVSEEEDDVMCGCDAEVIQIEQSKQKEEKGATNVKHNQPEEKSQSHIVEKHIVENDQLMGVTDDKDLPCEQTVDMKAEHEVAKKLPLKEQLCNEGLPETLHIDDKVREDQILLTARSEAQEFGVIKECSGKQKLVEGASTKQIGSKLQQTDLSGEQVDLQKQNQEKTDNKFHTQEQQQRQSMGQDQLQKQEVRLGDEQDSVMQCEAQITVASVERQHHVIEEQIRPIEQPNKGKEEEFKTYEQQRDVMEQVQLGGEVEDAKDEHQQEPSKVKEKHIVLVHGGSNSLQDSEMTHPEAEIEGTSEEHNKSELHQDHLENQETVTSKVQPQQEGQQNKVLQDKSELMNKLTEVKQDLMMIQSGSQLGRTSVEYHKVQQDDNLASSSSTIEVSRTLSCNSLGVAKAYHPDHEHRDKQKHPLRQGLRSSGKKEKATAKPKNQLERVTPVRRSLRPRKTVSEAAVVIQKDTHHSKEQLKHSGDAIPSKRKSRTAEAEQVSKLQKTRRTGL